jgi:hypothetical protein
LSVSGVELRPEDVFTPKNDKVNPISYVVRDGVDLRFLQIVKNNRHIMVTAPSGSGKTWLYKRVFEENEIFTRIIDCSNVSRLGGFDAEFERHLATKGVVIKQGYSEKKNAALKIPVAEGGISNEREYAYYEDDSFLKFLEEFKQEKAWVIVIENMESIARNEKFLTDLSNLLKLLDNPDYGVYNAKFLLIGTMQEVGSLFDAVADREPVVNRITEFNNLRPLNSSEVSGFIKNTFDALNFVINANDLEYFTKIVLSRTDGVPQRLHELCYEFAVLMDDEKSLANVKKHVSLATQRWVHTRFTAENKTVNELIMVLGTRKLELLYVVLEKMRPPYTVKAVEDAMREYFPKSVGGKALGVSQMLTFFRDKQILMTNKNGRGYLFQDDRMRMVLRARIKKHLEQVSFETLDESERLWFNKDA